MSPLRKQSLPAFFSVSAADKALRHHDHVARAAARHELQTC
eukprot:CAMPEP_0119387500 /NCGR_PEP_ID=MMETSP1334-20130426/100943_1 /TAXON_ID=127549 /ORGANISM="Calcidiscus leptoporus, Strain RCC1130" /LENGTH=40 /DNA_ID= /DNA_START= /DNA_END= /DNA_ORIENTATION=